MEGTPASSHLGAHPLDQAAFERGSARLFEVIRHVWGLSDRICPLRFPEGVFKHRPIEDAERLREQWEDANFRVHRARMNRSVE